MAEREEISRALPAGESIRCVAKQLKQAASAISRELGRCSSFALPCCTRF
ncbi:MAG: helix-turn-helix domain-containing protein [Comamonas sp.]